MVIPKITFKQETARLCLLKKHTFIESMGYLKPDNFYTTEMWALRIPKYPVVIDGYYLTSPEYIQAMLDAGVDTIDVLRVENATMNDLLRIVNLESRPWYRASKSMLYKAIKTIQSHMWNTEEGRQWRSSLPGDDINDVIGKIVGYSGSMVSKVKKIGDWNYAYLDAMDDPESNYTISSAEYLMEAEKRIQSKKDNYAGEQWSDTEDNEIDIDDSNDSSSRIDKEGEVVEGVSKNVTPRKTKAKQECIKQGADAVLTSFHVGFGKYGDFTLNLDGNTPAILMNDEFAGLVTIQPQKNNDLREGLHFIMQNADTGWSFHVIGTRISKLLKQKEVSCKPA